MEEHLFENYASDRERHIPKTGFNVVEIDSFSFPASMALHSHHEDEASARAALDALTCEGAVYDARGRCIAKTEKGRGWIDARDLGPERA